MAKRWCVSLAGLALVTGALAVAPAAASAATTHVAGRGAAARVGSHGTTLVRPGAAGTKPMTRLGTGSRNQAQVSSNWSGYAADSSTYSSVSAFWTEPTGHCSSGQQFSSFWVGLDGANSSTVEQTGSEVDCNGRSPVYFAWYEMFPANPVNFSDPVRPGDKFFGSVTHTSGSSYTLTLSDQTQGWAHTVHKTLAGAANSSAEVIAEAPCCTASGGILPLADFGTVAFSGAKVDGAPIGAASPVQIVMADTSGNQQDSVSNLNKAGKGFSATWLRST